MLKGTSEGCSLKDQLNPYGFIQPCFIRSNISAKVFFVSMSQISVESLGLKETKTKKYPTANLLSSTTHLVHT